MLKPGAPARYSWHEDIDVTDRSWNPDQPLATSFTMAALADVLAERFGPGIAAAVHAQLQAEHRSHRETLAADLVARAVEMASEAEIAVAGTALVEHLRVSAVADAPDFRIAARTAGIRTDGWGIGQRLCVDAAFVSAWRASCRSYRPIDGRDAAIMLMTEILQSRP